MIKTNAVDASESAIDEVAKELLVTASRCYSQDFLSIDSLGTFLAGQDSRGDIRFLACEACIDMIQDAKVSLRKGDFGQFIKNFSEAKITLHEIRNVESERQLVLLISTRSRKTALVANAKKASEAAAEPNRAIKAKAVGLYKSGNFPSKNKAAEVIAPQIGRSVQVVRGWLKGI